MTPANDLEKIAVEGNVLKRLDDLEKTVRALKSGTLRVVTLEHISNDMGLQTAGEFRSGNGVAPGSGFTGTRLAYPALSYLGQTWNLVGVSNDVLEFGLAAVGGKATFGGGTITAGSTGLRQTIGGKETFSLDEDGNLSMGSDLSDPATTTLKIFIANTAYNGENFLAGDQLIGSNDTGKGNILIRPSDGTITVRHGVVENSETIISGGSGVLGPEGAVLSGLSSILKFYAAYLGEERWAQIGMGIAQGFSWPVFSMLFTGPAGDPLETNGDAETGDLTGWTDDESAWSASTTDPYVGARCFRHDPENDGCPGDLRQTITGLAANTAYALTFASKIASGILSPYCELVWKTSGGATISTDILQGNGSSAWAVNTQVFRSPATADRVELVFYPGDPFNDTSLDDIHFGLQAVSRELGFFPDLTYLGGALVLEEQA